MLIEFRVANHRSIRDEQVLSFEAANVGDPDDPRPRTIPGHKKKVLPVAAIYGANASGKSNVLLALAFMAHAVALSHRQWDPAGGVPRTPFAWGGGREQPSLFEVVLALDGVRYQYGFTCDDHAFVEEWLYAWPRGRKQTWFERDGQAVSFGDGLRGERQAAANVMRPNSLFLSSATQNNVEQLAALAGWFGRVDWHNLPFVPTPFGTEGTRVLSAAVFTAFSTQRFEDLASRHPRMRQLLVSFLTDADIGVDDFRVVDRSGERRVELHHPAGDHWMPLEEESLGTRGMFALAPSVLRLAFAGGLLVVDELDASLHPALAAGIVSILQDAGNIASGQLLFSTHDTSLLGTANGPPALRRDQVWLTEKNPATGGTELYPLTDYKPRKEENLERGYLQGRYGGVPFLGDLGAALSDDGT